MVKHIECLSVIPVFGIILGYIHFYNQMAKFFFCSFIICIKEDLMKIKLNKENIVRPIKTSTNNKKVKVQKLFFDEKEIKNSKNAFDIFEKKVTKIVANKDDVDANSFSGELKCFLNKYTDSNEINKMNNKFVTFAEKLVSLGKDGLAGIIYSFLIKANSNNPELVERFAINGLAIAKRFNDPVHIMARCENLRRIYSVAEPQSEKLLKVLYEEKRALNQISKNYQKVQNRFQTVTSGMKPIENYQIMLGAIKIQIAKIIKKSKPNEAMNELKEAKELLGTIQNGKLAQEVEKLLSEINIIN